MERVDALTRAIETVTPIVEQAPAALAQLREKLVHGRELLRRGHPIRSVSIAGWAPGKRRNGWAVGHDATVLHTQDGGVAAALAEPDGLQRRRRLHQMNNDRRGTIPTKQRAEELAHTMEMRGAFDVVTARAVDGELEEVRWFSRDELRASVKQYLDNELGALVADNGTDPTPTSGFQRVVQRAILHVQSSGRDEVTGATTFRIVKALDAGPVFGIMPRNLQQAMALDLLLDDSVKLVSLIGSAWREADLWRLQSSQAMSDLRSMFVDLLTTRPTRPRTPAGRSASTARSRPTA